MTTYSKLRLSLSAALCLIAACIPPPGGYSSQPQQSGWEQGPTATSSEGEEYGSSGGGDSSGWLCTAEGRLGTSYDGSWSYSTEQGQGGGPTRDDAHLHALENCNSLLNLSVTLATSEDKQLDIGTCEVTNCIGPGR